MQANEFEKQVQQKMDELRLVPSQPVWPRIEEELRGKRKRRLILIPLFAVMLVAGYFAWKLFIGENKTAAYTKQASTINTEDKNKNLENKETDNENKQTDKIITAPVTLNDKSENNKPTKENVKTKQATTEKEKAENLNTKQSNTEKANKEEKKSGNTTSAGKSENEVTLTQHKLNVRDTRIKNGNIITANSSDKHRNGNVPDNNKSLSPEQAKVESNKAEYNDQVNISAGEQFTFNNNLRPDSEPVIIDELPGNHISVDSINKAPMLSLQLPPLTNLNLKRLDNALKFGIVFSAGASSRVNKPLQLNSSEKSTSAVGLDRYTLFSNVGGGVSILPPSEVKPGAAFKVGVIAMKPLSKRFDVSVALQYSYSSDQIRVGKSIGSPSSSYNSTPLAVLSQAYYPNVQNENHTNKYHFIELPVSIYYNLSRKWKTPVVWNLGASVSQLVSSDVLLYDVTWGGIYYKGNNDLNKTQVNLSTGFSFRFTGNNRWQWSIGPQIYMSATKLFQSEYDKNQHPVYGGLNVQILLPGKKK